MVRVVDAYGHFVLEELHEAMLSQRSDMYTSDTYRAVRELTLEEYIDDMDDVGVDHMILSQQPAPVWKGLDADEALSFTRLANDEIRSVADQYPDRFTPVATLPFLTDEYIDEFHRCIEELDMAGVQIFTNSGDRPLDSEAVYPFYEAVEEADVPIWLHPQDSAAWSDWDNLNKYSLSLIYGWPCETSIAMTRLVLSGVMQRYPDLSIICHHMGGPVAHFSNRIEAFYTWRDEADNPYPAASIDDDIRKFYPDTARQGSPDILEDGCEFFGQEKMVFGTDYPFGPNMGKGFLTAEREAVAEMDVSETVKQRILGGNIESLVDL